MSSALPLRRSARLAAAAPAAPVGCCRRCWPPAPAPAEITMASLVVRLPPRPESDTPVAVIAHMNKLICLCEAATTRAAKIQICTEVFNYCIESACFFTPLFTFARATVLAKANRLEKDMPNWTEPGCVHFAGFLQNAINNLRAAAPYG